MKPRWSLLVGPAVMAGVGFFLFSFMTSDQGHRIRSGDSPKEAIHPEEPIQHSLPPVREEMSIVPGITDHPQSDAGDGGTTADATGRFLENRTPFNVGTTSIHPDDADPDEADSEVVHDVGGRLENPLQEVQVHSGEPVRDIGPHVDPMNTSE